MSLEADAAAPDVSELGVAPLGVAALEPSDNLDARWRSVTLFGPDPERFWPIFSASAERKDGAPHPLDRWSRRIGDALATRLGAHALFPFDGPPYYPFLSWAIRSGRAHPSPIGFVVHDRLGLWFSVRFALASTAPAPRPAAKPSPCDACRDRPCVSACPVDAFSAAPAYDVGACAAHLDAEAGAPCRMFGCRARAACPIGAETPYPPERAAFHIAAFRAARA